ncbi:MAG: FGGY family carbohydrate kinase, partial [Acidimicrobiales bacterium]
MSAHILAIDLGSSGVKVAVVDEEGRVLGHGSEALPMVFLPGGGAEQDAEGWWAAIGRCARRAMAGSRAADVAAVAVTSQYMSIVAIDQSGLPLMNAVMWMDTRGRRHNRHLRTDHATELWLDRHGLPPPGDLAHIAFIRSEFPAIDAATAAYVEPVDYLNARLSGRIAATQTTAFPLMTMDNRVHGNLEYSEELVTLAGIDPEKLAPLVPYDEILGPVTPAAAEHLGITTSAVVVTGTIDSITSAVGTGALDATACSIIVGTTSVMVTHVDFKAGDVEHGVISVPSPLPGKYFVMAENGVGGKALEFLLRNVVYADDAFATGA